MIQALATFLLILAAYWLPGAAAASLIEWRGLGRAARLFAPFALSLVVTPVLLALPTWFISYQPTPWILGGFSAVLFLTGRLLARSGRRPVLEFRPRAKNPASRREFILGAFFLSFVALHLLLYGSEVSSAGISDIYWHLSELTALAHTGLPPRHDLFPDLPLVYYYWSLVYPAILASLPVIGDSLMRLLNLQAAAILTVFLFVLYLFIRANLNSAGSRAFALIFLTLAGGLDFFTGPSMNSHEWWQLFSPAIVSQAQVASPLTTYMWVPQHLAGAAAFLLILLLWQNVRGSLAVRGVLAAVLAAFLLGTSAFVFFSAAAAGLVWAVIHHRALLRRRILPAAGALALVFLALAGPQIALSLSQSGAVRWGEFRLVLAEAATAASYPPAVILDQVLTLLALPVVASAILTIEIGLPFVLYAVWFFRGAGRRASPWRRFLAWYPAVYIPIAFLLLAPNFSMRGMIPVQILVVFAAALMAEEIGANSWTRFQKTVLRYGLIVILLAQMISPAVEWMVLARGALAQTLRLPEGFLPLPIRADAFPDGDNRLIPASNGLNPKWQYIHWANANLPRDAVVVETPIPLNYNFIHLLERMRVADPAEVGSIENGVRDLTLVNPAGLAAWWASLGEGTPAQKALRTEYLRRTPAPVYLIVHGEETAPEGEPLYRDAYAAIYLLQAGGEPAGKASP
jgi:hypothetical protein